jgi:hypothetical protein
LYPSEVLFKCHTLEAPGLAHKQYNGLERPAWDKQYSLFSCNEENKFNNITPRNNVIKLLRAVIY